MAQVIFHGVQVVEVGVQIRVHENRGEEEDGEGQVEVEREDEVLVIYVAIFVVIFCIWRCGCPDLLVAPFSRLFWDFIGLVHNGLPRSIVNLS